MNSNDSSSFPPPNPSALLAPGFRFHPTDEELVSYYLRRKIAGRSFRLDAIAEVDLYKAEPWDLPALSRLQSRDTEWYFFSPLDRKYESRSRTNRATSQGYWKTTGKDRPVRRNARTVGMKKTLVFHVGRAPRGERTNWVMHEYRLEDAELAVAGIAQDAYVVCRIFQKTGSGPQNGAQYGAPFIEEEWEETDMLVRNSENGEEVFADAVDQEYLQLDDFETNQDLGIQHEHAALLTEPDGQDGSGHLEDPTTMLEEILKDQDFVNGMGEINGMGENTAMADQSVSYSPSQNDDYVELNNLVNTGNADYPSVEDSGHLKRSFIDKTSVYGEGESSNLPEMHDVGEFFHTKDENADLPEPFEMHPTVEGDIYLQPNNLLNPMTGSYPHGQLAEENMVFFDAPSDTLPSAQESFVQMDDLLYPSMADSSGFDDLMAYFDATDDNLHYASLDSCLEKSASMSSILDHSNFSPEVDGGSIQTSKVSTQALDANVERGASSSVNIPEADNWSSGKNVETTVAPDIQKSEGWDGTLTKRLVNMLGSISSPPAFAAEFPASEGKSFIQNSATHSTSSIHVTAGMIQISGLTVTHSSEYWSLQKNSDAGFLLSYGMSENNNVVGKSVGFDPTMKVHGGAMSMLLRGGFYLFFLSALILAASYKIGVCIYSR